MFCYKKSLAQDFSKAAFSYNQNSLVQKFSANHLITEMLRKVQINDYILDLGCGTGFLGSLLHGKVKNFIQIDIAKSMTELAYETNKFPSIVADIENLPFALNSFDFLISSSSLQWCDLNKAFSEARRTLKQDGLFLFNILGSESLKILHQYSFLNLHPLPGEKEIYDASMILGKKCYLGSQNFIQTYPSLLDFLHSLKSLGARSKIRGKMSKEIFQKISKTRDISISWQIISLSNFKLQFASENK